jgi:hypothetical protein
MLKYSIITKIREIDVKIRVVNIISFAISIANRMIPEKIVRTNSIRDVIGSNLIEKSLYKLFLALM